MSEVRASEVDEVRAGRRQLTLAVLLCLAGAGLAVFAATRTWVVELTVRPEPLPALREPRTGSELLPWLSALAVVGLAGTGAVLATRGMGRRLLGGLLLLIGLSVTAGGGYGAAGLVHGDVDPQWPGLCVLGGLLAAAGGAITMVRGRNWPAMGARYERRTAGTPVVAERSPVEGDHRVAARRTVEAWDALDRGEDPTAG